MSLVSKQSTFIVGASLLYLKGGMTKNCRMLKVDEKTPGIRVWIRSY